LSVDEVDAPTDPHADERALATRLRELRERVRSDPGGATARARIDALLDAGSFAETGTFATFDHSVTSEGPHVYGGGIIGGHGRVDGRPVTVAADDGTGAAGAGRWSNKAARLYEMAAYRRNPYVELAEGIAEPPVFPGDGKAGIPNPRTLVAEPAFPWLLRRDRQVPVVAAVVGDVGGSHSFSAGVADFVVRVGGTRFSVDAAPRPAAADGADAPAGKPVVTGEHDLLVGSADDAIDAVRRFLGYLPSYAGGAVPVAEPQGSLDDDEVGLIVPARRSRAYDMKAVVRQLCDPGSFLETRPDYARNVVTGLGRMGGMPVGIVANAPMHSAGALTPESCVKTVSAIAMCDAFGLPIVLLHDTPGFLVSAAAERDRAVTKAMAVVHALTVADVPKISVVVRKSFGLAFVAMAANHEADLFVAWPGAEIGFMDPPVAANVLFEPQIKALPEDERPAFVAERIRELSVNFEPYGVATNMAVDDIIDPATTRRSVVEHLQVVWGRTGRPDGPSLLAGWPRWS
jgi:acetyl-CoA carboxylase carboxyltransferase component